MGNSLCSKRKITSDVVILTGTSGEAVASVGPRFLFDCLATVSSRLTLFIDIEDVLRMSVACQHLSAHISTSYSGLTVCLDCRALPSLLRICTGPALHSLTIIGTVDGNNDQFLPASTQVTDERIVLLARHCMELVVLDLSDCDVSDLGIHALANNCPNLKWVDLSRCNVSDVSIQALAVNCLKLDTVKLDECEQISDTAVESLAENCRELCEITLIDVPRVTDVALVALANNSHKLSAAYLGGTSVTDFGITKLAECCSMLSSIHLGGCDLTDVGAQSIAHYVNAGLRLLFLGGCSLVCDVGMISIAQHCPKLTEIVVMGTRVTIAGITALADHSGQRTIICWPECEADAADIRSLNAAHPNIVFDREWFQDVYYDCDSEWNLSDWRSI